MTTSRTEIELRALSALNAHRRLPGIEDNFVELKGVPPEPDKKARQIAAAANAAAGETVLWIFGANASGGFVDLGDFDFDEWFIQAKKQFDGPYPVPTTTWIDYEGHRLLAVAFRTDQTPYVVKSTKSPDSERDIPWREGATTRSARRNELLGLVSGVLHVPAVDVLAAQVALQPSAGAPVTQKVADVFVSLELLIEPRSSEQTSIAAHRCRLEATVGPHVFVGNLGEAGLRSTAQDNPRSSSLGVHQHEAGVVVTGPGIIRLNTPKLGTTSTEGLPVSEAIVRVTLGFAKPLGTCVATIVVPRFQEDRFLLRNAHAELKRVE